LRAVGPAPAKMWAEWAQSRRRCGHGVSPALAQMLAGVSAGSGVAIASGPEQVGVGPFDLRRATGVPSRSAVPISRPEEIGAGHRAWKLPRRTETSASHGNFRIARKRATGREWLRKASNGSAVAVAQLQRNPRLRRAATRRAMLHAVAVVRCMLLYIARCTLHVVRCMFYVACFTLHAARCCMLCAAHRALHAVRCTVSLTLHEKCCVLHVAVLQVERRGRPDGGGRCKPVRSQRYLSDLSCVDTRSGGIPCLLD
jgi:hypothetical protein